MKHTFRLTCVFVFTDAHIHRRYQSLNKWREREEREKRAEKEKKTLKKIWTLESLFRGSISN